MDHATEVNISCTPFSVTPFDVTIDMQLEIIDLQRYSNVRENVSSVALEYTSIFLIPIPN